MNVLQINILLILLALGIFAGGCSKDENENYGNESLPELPDTLATQPEPNYRHETIPSLIMLTDSQLLLIAELVKGKDRISGARDAAMLMFKLPEEISLELQSYDDSDDECFISFAQYYRGVRVDGSRCVVHSKYDVINIMTGNLRTIDPNLSVTPLVSKEEAYQKAKAAAGEKEESDNSLEGLFIFFNEKDEATLSYKFHLNFRTVYINALNAKVELEYRSDTNCF